MTGLGTLLRRVLGGVPDFARLIVERLLLGGDPITAVSAAVGIALFAVAFGVAGYAVAGAVATAVGRSFDG